ncbi:MAG: hypothetical protein HKN58_01185 [Xanthomonadales bacterium]|nr:hypothetical protein [Xanthomonadales bacterium]
MTRFTIFAIALSGLTLGGTPAGAEAFQPYGRGPHCVGSTRFEVAEAFGDIGDDAMRKYLSGLPDRFIDQILQDPESSWVIEVDIPDDSVYGTAAGQRMPMAAFLTFPAKCSESPRPYRFPFADSQYGAFEDMLKSAERPRFADPDAKYPLIIHSHGMTAHGIYDVGHAHGLASHGYVVAVLFYGDNRFHAVPGMLMHAFLRPLFTRAALDAILESEHFGSRINHERIGITGHSLGGFTALALAGAPFHGNPATVHDPRIGAAVLAAPWVGDPSEDGVPPAFGPQNRDLDRVTIPVLTLFGTSDEATPASLTLPAVRYLSGPSYVVELIDQPHVFEQGSWADRDNWELLFFSAFLKDDPASLKLLNTASSAAGGNADRQLFDYQAPAGNHGSK